jgi:hydrogenase-4 component F
VILFWLPVLVPWAGAALLAATRRRPPVLAGPAVTAASLVAALALGVAGEGERPDVLRLALLLCGAVFTFLLALADAATRSSTAPENDGGGRFRAAGLPALQGAQALALLAADPAVAWAGLAFGAGAGTALVAISERRQRAFAAAWRMLLLCGAGLALALLGVAMMRMRGTAGGVPPAGLSGVGFVLVLLGYGALAGLAPLNAWLPRAVAVAAPPVAAALAGLLPPAALHVLFRAGAEAALAEPASGGLPAAGLLAAVGLATTLLAAVAAWRRAGPAEGELPGWSALGLAGLAALGAGLGGAAGDGAAALLLLALPFCVGAAVLGAASGVPVAVLGRVSLAGMPPFAPFAAVVLLFSAVAALPAGLALPLGAALLATTATQLGAAAWKARGRGALPHAAAGRGRLLVSAPAWLLLGLALALGAALPEGVAAALAEAASLAR